VQIDGLLRAIKARTAFNLFTGPLYLPGFANRRVTAPIRATHKAAKS
jgi:hypothetical protein